MTVWYPQARAILQIVFDGFSTGEGDSDPLVIPVLPKAVTIHANSYKQADSWEITCDANDLPLDPDLVRAGAVEIYLYQTEGFETGRRGLSRQAPLAPVDDRQLEVGPPVDPFTLSQRPSIAGLFDEDSVELDGSGKWVTITGQDYTAHLAAMQWPPTAGGRARKIPVGRRIDVILREILAEADPDGRLTLVVRNLDASELPIVGVAEVAGNRRGIPVQQETRYWDVMYKLAVRYGLILFVDALDVVLSRPQNITASEMGRVLQFAWGRNVESLKISRHLGAEQVPTIVMQGYDPKTKRSITVEYPEGQRQLTEKTIKNDKTIKGDVRKAHTTERIRAKSAPPKRHGKTTTTVRKKDEYEIFAVRGVTDPAILRASAENLYHLLGRGERKVVLRTKDLKDLANTDLLQVRAGSAVTVAFDDYNRELLSNPAVPEAAKVDHLVSRGYNEAVAQIVAERFTLLEGLRRPMRVREATFEFDVETGISIELELVDFVVVDGSRDGIDKQTRVDAREQRLRHADGSRVGLGATPEEEAARLKQGGSL